MTLAVIISHFIQIIIPYLIYCSTQVPLREAVENFFNSPAWKEMKQSMHDLYQFCNHNGWNICWSQLIELIDPTGESHAYRVSFEYASQYINIPMQWLPS